METTRERKNHKFGRRGGERNKKRRETKRKKRLAQKGQARKIPRTRRHHIVPPPSHDILLKNIRGKQRRDVLRIRAVGSKNNRQLIATLLVDSVSAAVFLLPYLCYRTRSCSVFNPTAPKQYDDTVYCDIAF